MYIVKVTSEQASDGCYSKTFASLGDEARAFIKTSAASFRGAHVGLKCVATILKSGTALSEARVLEC